MKAFDPVCTSTMIEKPHGQYVRRDDFPSLLEALNECYLKMQVAADDLQEAVLDLRASIERSE